MSDTKPTLKVAEKGDQLYDEVKESYSVSTNLPHVSGSDAYNDKAYNDFFSAISNKNSNDVNIVVENFYNTYILGKIEKTETDWKYKREVAILKYIVEGSVYDLNSNTAYDVLINKKGQCSAFASAFSLLCEKCEIECYILTGQEHAWNIVRLDDGNLYHVDVTYAVSAGGDYYSNCNLTDAECKKLDSIHHAWWQPDMNAVGGKYGHLVY